LNYFLLFFRYASVEVHHGFLSADPPSYSLALACFLVFALAVQLQLSANAVNSLALVTAFR
jgi:hypothetical protein